MASEQTKILPQGKVTNEDTEMLSKKKMENEITKMLPEKEMANEETKIVLEGESADGETNILLKKESANGETKLYCMDSGDGPYSYARCSCSQVANFSSLTVRFPVTFKQYTKSLFYSYSN